MNLRELKDRVFRLTGGVYRDQEHIRVLLNEAITQMSEGAKLQVEATITLVPGISRYTLPADFKSVIGLFEGETCDPCYAYDLVDPMDGQCGYGIYGDDLVFVPTPSDAKTLHFYYYAYPTEMLAETDLLPIDARYAQAVVSYAAAMILALPEVGGTQALIDRYFMIWDGAQKRFKVDMQKRHKLASVRKVAKYW